MKSLKGPITLISSKFCQCEKQLLLPTVLCALIFAVGSTARADGGQASPAAPTADAAMASTQQAAASDDNDMMGNWLAKVSEIQSEQPHWVTPLMTVTPRLEQEVRYDQYWQTTTKGNKDTGNYGGGKGLEFIPFQNTEVIVGIPAYETHNIPTGENGFADETLLFKYRLLSANEENGDYILTAFLGLSIPSGSRYETEDHEITTPTLAFGKGWGNFDIQDTLGIQIPDDGASPKGDGTPVVSNTAFQYRICKWATPELEFNYTYFPNGDRSRINQLYITPGIVLGKFSWGKRVGFTVGVGYQIAATEDAKYNHNVVLSVRMPF